MNLISIYPVHSPGWDGLATDRISNAHWDTNAVKREHENE